MAKHVTPRLYSKLRDTESLRPKVNPVAGYMLKVSASGFSLDATIQTGVDNPWHPFILIVGALARDSHEAFGETFLSYHRRAP